MKEICLLNDSFVPIVDGVVNAVSNYARVLTQRGDGVCVVAPDCPGADDAAFPYPVYRYPSIDFSGSIGYTAGIPASYPLLRKLEGHDVGLLHSHCPMASNYLARSLRETLNVPLVMTYHTKYDVDIAKVIRSRLLREGALQAVLNNIYACDEVWTVSRGAIDDLRKIGYGGECTVMRNGVDVPRRRLPDEDVRRYTAGAHLPEGVPVFLFVGRLMWYKGIRLILEALAALASQGRDMRMVFIGSGGDEKEIRARVSEMGLDGKCLFMGAVKDRDELCAWYCRADLFLFPSTFDTNGLVVREAAACSLASVLVRGSCAAEDTADRRNCLWVDETAASLAVCLSMVMDRRDFLRQLGRQAAQELYLSWDDAVDTARGRYEEVMENYRMGRYPRHRKLLDGVFQAEAGIDRAARSAGEWGRRGISAAGKLLGKGDGTKDEK